jgi:hypothetical protein
MLNNLSFIFHKILLCYNFIFFYSHNTYFIMLVLKFKYKPGRLVNHRTFHWYAVAVCGLLAVLSNEPYQSAIHTIKLKFLLCMS